jgi:hypothetical protein
MKRAKYPPSTLRSVSSLAIDCLPMSQPGNIKLSQSTEDYAYSIHGLCRYGKAIHIYYNLPKKHNEKRLVSSHTLRFLPEQQ